MQQRVWTIIRRGFGYLLFALVVLVITAWLLFPAQAVRSWLNAELQQRVAYATIRVQGIGLVFPVALELKPVRIEMMKGSKIVPITVDYVLVRPQLLPWLRTGQPHAQVEGRCAQGMFRADLKAIDGGAIHIAHGILEGIQLQDPFFSLYFDRSMSGIVHGSFSGEWTTGGGTSRMTGELNLEQGRIGFQQEVLGFEAFDVSQAMISAIAEGDAIRIAEGQVESPLFSGSFGGEIFWSVSGRGNQVTFQGLLKPRSELFMHLRADSALDALKRTLENEVVPFTISGTMQRPGLDLGEYNQLLAIPLQGT